MTSTTPSMSQACTPLARVRAPLPAPSQRHQRAPSGSSRYDTDCHYILCTHARAHTHTHTHARTHTHTHTHQRTSAHSASPATLHLQLVERRPGRKAYLRLHTSLGDLNLELHADIAPRTCENFIYLAEMGYYNGTIFHRSIKNFMIQASILFCKASAGGRKLMGCLRHT
jgi:Cyclophilin type peptidyl-prolyl cis-trans isomerase/CLD